MKRQRVPGGRAGGPRWGGRFRRSGLGRGGPASRWSRRPIRSSGTATALPTTTKPWWSSKCPTRASVSAGIFLRRRPRASLARPPPEGDVVEDAAGSGGAEESRQSRVEQGGVDHFRAARPAGLDAEQDEGVAIMRGACERRRSVGRAENEPGDAGLPLPLSEVDARFPLQPVALLQDGATQHAGSPVRSCLQATQSKGGRALGSGGDSRWCQKRMLMRDSQVARRIIRDYLLEAARDAFDN
jgi:hypothetical protein